jgi:hypothetical protein
MPTRGLRGLAKEEEEEDMVGFLGLDLGSDTMKDDSAQD